MASHRVLLCGSSLVKQSLRAQCHGLSFTRKCPVGVQLCSMFSSSSTHTEKYFTSINLDGTSVDLSNAVPLDNLFANQGEICMDNHNSMASDLSFSDLSREIFRRLFTISFQQVKYHKRYLVLVPRNIMVTIEQSVVTGVAVSTASTTEEKSIYVDRIIGPVAVLILNLHREFLSDRSIANSVQRDDREILDLLLRARNKPWWSTLNDILSHPILWSYEKKLAEIVIFKQWMDEPKTGLLNTLSSTSGFRVRKLSPEMFRNAFYANFIYNVDYNVSTENEEYLVMITSRLVDWRHFFSNTFDPKYKFGPVGDLKVIGSLTHSVGLHNFVRNILIHLNDTNMNAFVQTLYPATVKTAMIRLDRHFGLSCTVFHAPRSIKMDFLLVE